MSIWIDKYRPMKLDEVSGHTDIINLMIEKGADDCDYKYCCKHIFNMY